MSDQTAPIVDFLKRFTTALGIETAVDVEHTADGPRLNLSGDEAELLVRAESLVRGKRFYGDQP